MSTLLPYFVVMYGANSLNFLGRFASRKAALSALKEHPTLSGREERLLDPAITQAWYELLHKEVGPRPVGRPKGEPREPEAVTLPSKEGCDRELPFHWAVFLRGEGIGLPSGSRAPHHMEAAWTMGEARSKAKQEHGEKELRVMRMDPRDGRRLRTFKVAVGPRAYFVEAYTRKDAKLIAQWVFTAN